MNNSRFFITTIFFTLTVVIHAQGCIADAGPDQHWCRNDGDTITIGNNPAVTNGTPPYTYEWSIDPIQLPPPSKITFYASTFLNDTTIANPKLIDFWEDEIAFILKITDANGLICTDTVVISASLFAHHTIHYTYNIWEGDSVQLANGPNIYPSRGPDSILWRPNHGLIDSNALEPWVKPERNMVYYSIVWDSMGCKVEGAPFQYVYVHHIGLPDMEVKEIRVYPTTLDLGSTLTIELPSGLLDCDFQLYDIRGSLTYERALPLEKQNFDLTGLSPGPYQFKILATNKILKLGKIIIK